MRFSNFVLTQKKGKNALDWEFFAEVDVTTGAFWWKKTNRKKIRRTYTSSWYFVETGEFTPGYEVESLARAWMSQRPLA